MILLRTNTSVPHFEAQTTYNGTRLSSSSLDTSHLHQGGVEALQRPISSHFLCSFILLSNYRFPHLSLSRTQTNDLLLAFISTQSTDLLLVPKLLICFSQHKVAEEDSLSVIIYISDQTTPLLQSNQSPHSLLLAAQFNHPLRFGLGFQ